MRYLQFKQLLVEVTLANKIVVFTFGRMNPPTSGHEKLIKKVEDVAKKNNGIAQIYPSQTQDNKRNPLNFDDKIKFLKLLFPNSNIIKNKNINNPFKVLELLDKEKVKKIIMVVGSDRVNEFKTNINQEKFDNIKEFEIISAGERDPDSNDASGASGTKQREFVKNNDFGSFKNGLPKTTVKIAKQLFSTLRKILK